MIELGSRFQGPLEWFLGRDRMPTLFGARAGSLDDLEVSRFAPKHPLVSARRRRIFGFPVKFSLGSLSTLRFFGQLYAFRPAKLLLDYFMRLRCLLGQHSLGLFENGF